MTKFKKFKKYIKETEVIQQRYINDLNELGIKIRKEVVVPVCKKYGLTFLSGNGAFYFYKDHKGYKGDFYSYKPHRSETRYEYEWQLPKNAMGQELKPILDLLETELTRNDHLGYYVDNYIDDED